MAHTKVSVTRKYYGKIPLNKDGEPISKTLWPKRRKCSWEVRWYSSEGSRYSKSFKERKEAIRYAEMKQREVRKGQADKLKSMTLEEFSKLYLEIRSDITDNTKKEHRRTLKFLKEYFGKNMLVDKITPANARRFVSTYCKRRYKNRPISQATANKVLRECQRIFREAVDCKIVSENPFKGIRQHKIGQSEWHYISPLEYQKLIQSCQNLKWKGIITIAYCCGLRRGEIINLTWQDIDFDKGILWINAKKDDGIRQAWTPKDKDRRGVPLSVDVLRVLVDLHNEAKDGQVYVIANLKETSNNSPINSKNLWRDFQVIRRRAGIPECSLHDLRKSYCTNLSNEIPIHVVQELAGHSDIRTTRRYYLKVRPENLEKAREAIDRLTDISISD